MVASGEQRDSHRRRPNYCDRRCRQLRPSPTVPGGLPRYGFRLNFLFEPATNYATLSSAIQRGELRRFQVASFSGRVVQGASGLPGVKVSAGTNISFTGAGGYYTNLSLPEGTNVRYPSWAAMRLFPPLSPNVPVKHQPPGFHGVPALASLKPPTAPSSLLLPRPLPARCWLRVTLATGSRC